MKKFGVVSIVGRPNVGKSTLLNAILDTKLAITSNKAGTTRNIIQGIYNDEECQIVFTDTPGIGKPMHKINQLMNKKAYSNTEGVDIILFLIDMKKGFGKGDEFILNKLKESNIPVFLLLNKIDLMEKTLLLEKINQLKDVYDFKEIIPISAYKKDNLNTLMKCIKDNLETSEHLYNEEEFTNVSTRFIIAEFVREKILELTKEEVPHAVTCYVENYEEDEKTVHVQVLIIVDRENLKGMIIGKGGQLLKEVGKRARYDIENLLGKQVYLETHVKTLKNWRDQEKYFQELGLKEDE